MRDLDAAIAVFAKTPGLSPIKTRLAEGLGREKADEFYRLSISAIEAAVAAATESFRISPYWAVAESAGLADVRWRRFPRIDQGTGSLGERLARVFAELGTRHPVVLAIGGDAPQISPQLIGQACKRLSDENKDAAHVLGRCHDGGFYLVGTKTRIPSEIWANVPYSTPSAADRLAAKLAKRGKIAELDWLTDVDQAEDLAALRNELTAIANPLPEQRLLLDWVLATLDSLNLDDSR